MNVSQRNSASRPPMQGKKTYIRKTKNIYAYICKDEEEEREFKKLTLHKWNADAAEGDELRVQTRNEGTDEK